MQSCQQAEPAKKHRIAFSQCCQDPWRTVMEHEMRRELAFHPEVSLDISIAGNNSQTQAEQIRELAKSDIDLLIVSPNESEPLTSVVEEVFRKGIPVILIDRKTESEAFTAYIGADNYQIGETAARYIANRFEGRGYIAELQLGMTMTPARDRNRGFRDALAKYPNMTIATQVELALGMDELKADFLKKLEEHPEINIIFAHNDFLAESAFNWIQSSGRKANDLFFVGIDGIPGLGQGIQ